MSQSQHLPPTHIDVSCPTMHRPAQIDVDRGMHFNPPPCAPLPQLPGVANLRAQSLS